MPLIAIFPINLHIFWFIGKLRFTKNKGSHFLRSLIFKFVSKNIVFNNNFIGFKIKKTIPSSFESLKINKTLNLCFL